jgi:hypothetical protein
MLALWCFLVLFCVIVLTYHVMIVTQIVDFQIDHVNPIDVCVVLEKRVKPVILAQIAVVVTCLLLMFKSWPIFILEFLVLAYGIYLKKKQGRLFNPITIVRESDGLKIRHGIAVAVQMVALIYAIIAIILSIID